MEITAAVANATSKNLAFCILITFQIFLQKEEYKIVEMMKQSQHHKSVTYCFSGKWDTRDKIWEKSPFETQQCTALLNIRVRANSDFEGGRGGPWSSWRENDTMPNVQALKLRAKHT